MTEEMVLVISVLLVFFGIIVSFYLTGLSFQNQSDKIGSLEKTIEELKVKNTFLEKDFLLLRQSVLEQQTSFFSFQNDISSQKQDSFQKYNSLWIQMELLKANKEPGFSLNQSFFGVDQNE